jgi:hypothetical protein
MGNLKPNDFAESQDLPTPWEYQKAESLLHF